MPTLRDLLNAFRNAKAELIRNREDDVLRIALDQIALTKLRIQTEGKNADGNPFPDYVPAYKRARSKAGYQTDFVDLTRTGRLMASIQPSITQSNVFTATVEIGGADQTSRDILAGLSGKRGNVLEPSAEELQILRDANRNRIFKYFQNLGQ